MHFFLCQLTEKINQVKSHRLSTLEAIFYVLVIVAIKVALCLQFPLYRQKCQNRHRGENAIASVEEEKPAIQQGELWLKNKSSRK